MTLRLTREDERILAELAEADGISRQEATVRAIREAAARRGHDRRVGEASARVAMGLHNGVLSSTSFRNRSTSQYSHKYLTVKSQQKLNSTEQR